MGSMNYHEILYVNNTIGYYLNISIPTIIPLIIIKIISFFYKKFFIKFKNILAPKIFKNEDWGLYSKMDFGISLGNELIKDGSLNSKLEFVFF